MRHETRSRLHLIEAPTLVIAGEADPVCPPAYNQDIADGIAGAEFVVLPGQAHQPFQEIPDVYNALVADFWSRT